MSAAAAPADRGASPPVDPLFLATPKVGTFQGLGALPAEVIFKGLIVGAALMAGSFIARAVVLRISAAGFRLLMDALLLTSGLTLLWAALR